MSAVQLRQAATTLRETTLIRSDLAEPLAAWLETTADVMIWLGPVEVRDEADDTVHWDAMGAPREEWDRAVDLARHINGVAIDRRQIAIWSGT